ncbi:MAG: hypothetical protein ABR570_01510 [Burkholderiales bacterium]
MRLVHRPRLARLIALRRFDLVDAPLLLDDRLHVRIALAPLAAAAVAITTVAVASAAPALAIAFPLRAGLLRLGLGGAWLVWGLRLRL